MFFEEPPYYPSNSGSHDFPIIHLVMTCLFCKGCKNVLEFLAHFSHLLVLKSTKYVLELNLNSKYNKIPLTYFAFEMFQKVS